jgi:Amt family ammonium transporter
MQDTDLLLLLLGLAVLIGRAGSCLYLTGMSRSRNAAATVVRSVADLCVAVLAFWAVGHAIFTHNLSAMFGRHGTFGGNGFFGCTIVLIATGAALGGTLERTNLLPTLIASAILAAFLMPLVSWCEWSGWLHSLGLIDVGAAGSLHLTGGICAAVGAMVVGPRRGKYNQDGSTNLIPGHNFPMTSVGALVMIAGILPQLAGCAILHDADPFLAAADGLLAAAAGGLAGVLFGRIRYGITDVHLAIIGLLGGLVSAAAGAGVLPTYAAVLIGGVAGFLAPLAAVRLDLRHKIDDPASSFSIHAIGGAWGLLAAGLLVHGSLSDRVGHLAIQAAGLAVIAILSIVVWAAVWLAMRLTLGLRLGEADELDGSDLAEYDVNAYPDFQQTTIKSYHLRET